jgi:serine/threonine protein kinase
MPLAPCTKLGPYEIHSPLGAGGMGEVYHARDANLGHDVVLKVRHEAFPRGASGRQHYAGYYSNRTFRRLESRRRPSLLECFSEYIEGW